MHRTITRASLLSLLYTPLFGLAQTQVVKGVVKDMDSEELLPGVSIAVIDIDPKLTATSDIDGRFRLEAVPLGPPHARLQLHRLQERNGTERAG